MFSAKNPCSTRRIIPAAFAAHPVFVSLGRLLTRYQKSRPIPHLADCSGWRPWEECSFSTPAQASRVLRRWHLRERLPETVGVLSSFQTLQVPQRRRRSPWIRDPRTLLEAYRKNSPLHWRVEL